MDPGFTSLENSDDLCSLRMGGIWGHRTRRTAFLLIMVAFISLLAVVASPLLCRGADVFQIPCTVGIGHTHLDSFQQDEFHRSQFPADFIWGTATASYQVEGAIHEGGRGPTIWDNFTHTPGKIADGTNGNVAADQYHLYEDDIDLMSSMHVNAYRFSIAWARIFPDGKGPKANKDGVAYYNRLIDALLRRGIQPYVTLYHWDLPQHLQQSMEGWLSREIVGLYADYAEACFEAFGDRVKHWITFNEPQSFSWIGYGSGEHAPGRTSDRSLSVVGNSSTDPYIVSHHVLLAHASAYHMYQKKFKAAQGGSVAISVDCEWAVPFTDSLEDSEASERRVLFELGWFLDPIFFGDYPAVMRTIVGARLPNFTEDERALLHKSLDFIGINHYTSKWVKDSPRALPTNYIEDQCVETLDVRDGVEIGPQAYSKWLRMVPWGAGQLLAWVYDRYKMPIFVTENGCDTENLQTLGQPLPAGVLNDTFRVHYHKAYLQEILSAIRQGVDIRSYFVWSFLDNFEWALGHTSRYGLVYTDFATMIRYPKSSFKWFAEFLGPKDGGKKCRLHELGFRFLKRINIPRLV